MHAGRGRDLITDKRPPCYACQSDGWILIRDGESNLRDRLRGDCKYEKRKMSVTGLERNERCEVSDSSASEIK